MKYRIISVGKIREAFYLAGIKEYIKRLGPYANIELVDGLEEKLSPNAGERDIAKLLKKEGDRILNMIDRDEILVILDIAGQMLSSEDLAEQVNKWNVSGKSRINLVIGSSFGLSDDVRKRADIKVSFSKMTFPHQMAVLILTEQIYRAFKILKGEPYHK